MSRFATFEREAIAIAFRDLSRYKGNQPNLIAVFTRKNSGAFFALNEQQLKQASINPDLSLEDRHQYKTALYDLKSTQQTTKSIRVAIDKNFKVWDEARLFSMPPIRQRIRRHFGSSPS